MGLNNKNTFDTSGSCDDDPIARLYDTHANDLFIWGKTFTDDRELVKDCIENLFLYLLAHRRRLKNIQNTKVYLFQCLRNNLISRLRERNLTIRKDCSNDKTFQRLIDTSPDPEDIMSKKEQRFNRKKLLNSLFDTLTATQKRLINLRFYQQMEYEEICEVLQLNYQSARTLTYRAICRMRKAYQKTKKIQ